jgi:peptidoglycan/xylan/chitin deacetylase (PgdA/CDA1 family)
MSPSLSLEASARSMCSVTVDVESDWGGRVPPRDRGVEGCRYSIPRLLDLFDRFSVRSTFFVSSAVTGAIASELREIASRGHEIASHGWRHQRYDRLVVADLDEELQISKITLENITGLPVLGFRSPQFVLNSNLFAALVRAGYKYDSSLVAGRLPSRYNNTISDRPFWKDGVLEVPIGRLAFTPLPNGLLWLNLIRTAVPLHWLPYSSKQLEVFYFHPFDLYPAKYTARFDWKINLWYLFRQKHVHATLEAYLQRVAERSRFVKMQDLLMQDWDAS